MTFPQTCTSLTGQTQYKSQRRESERDETVFKAGENESAKDSDRSTKLDWSFNSVG